GRNERALEAAIHHHVLERRRGGCRTRRRDGQGGRRREDGAEHQTLTRHVSPPIFGCRATRHSTGRLLSNRFGAERNWCGAATAHAAPEAEQDVRQLLRLLPERRGEVVQGGEDVLG